MKNIDRFALTPLQISLITKDVYCSLSLRSNDEINDIIIILWWAIAREVKILNNY